MNTTQNTTLKTAGSIHRHRWLTVLAAMATANAVWAISHSLLNIELTVGSGNSRRDVDFLSVTLTALVVGFAAWGLLSGLERHSAHARTIWTAIAFAVLALSMLGPLGATTGAGVAVLAGLHLLVGGILIWGMRRPSVPCDQKCG